MSAEADLPISLKTPEQLALPRTLDECVLASLGKLRRGQIKGFRVFLGDTSEMGYEIRLQEDV